MRIMIKIKVRVMMMMMVMIKGNVEGKDKKELDDEDND